MAWAKYLEEEKRKYNSKKYNDKFRQKHAIKLSQKIECDICHNSYTYYSKSKHMKSKKHLKEVNKTPNNTPFENTPNIFDTPINNDINYIV